MRPADAPLSTVLVVDDDGMVKPRRSWREFFEPHVISKPAKAFASHQGFLESLERNKRVEIQFHSDRAEMTLAVLEQRCEEDGVA